MSTRWLPFSRCTVVTFFVLSGFAIGQTPAPPNEQAKKQAQLARHAQAFAPHDFGKPVEQRPVNPNGEIYLTAGFINDYPAQATLPSDPSPPKETIAADFHAPLVVLATALSFESAFTPARSFLYSDWAFRVDELFKNTSQVGVHLGGEVTVSRTGGKLSWNGKTVIAHDLNFPDFVVGEQYVLFLHAMKDDPNSFQAPIVGGAFRLEGNKVVPLEDPQYTAAHESAWASELSSEDFLALLRRSAQ